MSRKVDWKQAMLNEAEAAENEAWAKETRDTAFFNPLELSARQILPLFVVSILGGIIATLVCKHLFAWLSAGLCTQAASCGLSIGLGVVALLICLAGLGAFLFSWRVGLPALTMLGVVAGVRSLDLPLLQALGIGVPDASPAVIAAMAMPLLTLTPLYLGYSAAYRSALTRAKRSGQWVGEQNV